MSAQEKTKKAHSKNILKSVAYALVFASLISFGSCAPEQDAEIDKTIQSHKNQILLLESELSELRELYTESLESSNAEISGLKSEISSLKNLIEKYESTTPEQDTSGDVGFLYQTVDGQATITGYRGTKKAIIIPVSIDGYPVTAIGDEAFKNSTITSVSIPSTVTRIGWFAFCDCSSLTSAVVPSSVSEIGYEAFSGCKSLTIYTSSGSYAAKYAQSYGVAFSVE